MSATFHKKTTIFLLLTATLISRLGTAQAQVPDERDLVIHGSLHAAIQGAIADAKKPNRQTFFPVAVWRDAAYGRGAVLLTFSRDNPTYGECKEFVVSFISEESKPVIATFGRAACRTKDGDPYVVKSDVPAEPPDARRGRALSFIPPASLPVGTLWRVLNTERKIAHSLEGAIGLALSAGNVPATMVWEGSLSRGAAYVYDVLGAPECRMQVAAEDLLPNAYPVTEYCRYRDGPIVGWVQQSVKAASAAERAVVKPLLDKTIKDNNWGTITKGSSR